MDMETFKVKSPGRKTSVHGPVPQAQGPDNKPGG